MNIIYQPNQLAPAGTTWLLKKVCADSHNVRGKRGVIFCSSDQFQVKANHEYRIVHGDVHKSNLITLFLKVGHWSLCFVTLESATL